MMALRAAKSLVYLAGRAGVAVLVYASVHLATQLLPSSSTASTLAFTCVGNTVLFLGYLAYFAGTLVHQALTEPHPRRSQHPSVLLLEGNSEVYALRFQELVARCHAEASMVFERPPLATLTTTIPLLWCHIYAVGFCLFTLSYCVHGGSRLAALVAFGSSLACAFHNLLANPNQDGLSRLLLLFMYAAALVLLFTRNVTAPVESWLLCVVLPAASPVLLYNTQRYNRAQTLQLTATQYMVFGLPCVALMSICYLSAYLPIHECSSLLSTELTDIISYNATLEAPRVLQAHPLAVLGCVMTPAALWMAMLAYVDALLRPHRLIGVVGCFMLVHVGKEAVMDPGRREWQAGVALCSTAALLGIWLDPVPLSQSKPQVDARLQDEEEELQPQASESPT